MVQSGLYEPPESNFGGFSENRHCRSNAVHEKTGRKIEEENERIKLVTSKLERKINQVLKCIVESNEENKLW